MDEEKIRSPILTKTNQMLLEIIVVSLSSGNINIVDQKVIFDCCKQSLTWLYHPPIQCPTFCAKNERMHKHWIILLLFCAKQKTGKDRFFYFLAQKRSKY